MGGIVAAVIWIIIAVRVAYLLISKIDEHEKRLTALEKQTEEMKKGESFGLSRLKKGNFS